MMSIAPRFQHDPSALRKLWVIQRPLTWMASQNTIEVAQNEAEKLLKMIDALDDNDDVQRVAANLTSLRTPWPSWATDGKLDKNMSFLALTPG